METNVLPLRQTATCRWDVNSPSLSGVSDTREMETRSLRESATARAYMSTYIRISYTLRLKTEFTIN